MTRFEKIKAMTIEEMAAWLAKKMDCDNCYRGLITCDTKECKKWQTEWLESEVDDE